MTADQALHLLVPLSECKSALGFDDRDDDFSRFLLVAATATVESQLQRRILRRSHTQCFDSLGQNAFFLREYPVREINSVHEDRTRMFSTESLIHPEHYYCTPAFDSLQEFPSTLALIPPYRMPRAEKSIKVVYSAGYTLEEVPQDLKQAVIELVAWSHTRYKTRRIGVTAALRGTGAERESLERTIPEYVCTLLEPYRRRTV